MFECGCHVYVHVLVQIILIFLSVPNSELLVQPVSFIFVFVIVTTTIRSFLINLIKV